MVPEWLSYGCSLGEIILVKHFVCMLWATMEDLFVLWTKLNAVVCTSSIASFLSHYQ